MQFTLISLLAAAGPALVAAQAGSFVAITGYNSLGCYKEPEGARALSAAFADQAAMTVQMCASLCPGYTYIGVEYGIECYCGNTLVGGALDADVSKCDMTCVGNESQNCGGHNTLSLYILNGKSIPPPAPAPALQSSSTIRTSTVAPIISSSKSSSIAKSTTVAGVVMGSTTKAVVSSTMKTSTVAKTSTSPATATGFSYVGCFKDSGNLVPIVKAAVMNPSICMAAAKAKATAAKPTKFLYVAVEAGSICLGASKEPAKPTSLIGAKACTSTCVGAGNAAQTCGGKNQYNLYASVTGSAFSGPVKTKAA